MKTPYNRFAIIPFHCTDCHRYIWLEKYRKAEVWRDLPPSFLTVKKKICKDCLKRYNIKTEGGMIDYRRAFKIACDLLNGDGMFGVDAEKIFEIMMDKNDMVTSTSYEEYILNHLQELDHGQYAER